MAGDMKIRKYQIYKHSTLISMMIMASPKGRRWNISRLWKNKRKQGKAKQVKQNSNTNSNSNLEFYKQVVVFFIDEEQVF